MVDHVLEDPVEVEVRLPADRALDLLDRRHAVEHVVDPEPVHLVVRDVHELRLRAGQLEHALRELQHGDPVPRADVEDLTDSRGLIHQPLQGTDRVLDVAERPRLRPVAVDLERRARDRGLREPRDDHPVLTALTRTDGVEEARDHELEAALLPVGER